VKKDLGNIDIRAWRRTAMDRRLEKCSEEG
jgi:hypothetical protein